MKLSIVIPAQNEEQRMGTMMDAYLPYFTDIYGDEVEFIIVVNGSTDGTEAAARKYAAKHSCLSVIVEPKPVGKGGALMMGFEKATGDFVGFADADGATPPEAFKDLVDNIGDAGCIIASRWCKGAKVSPRQPLMRRIASRVFNVLTRLLFGLRVSDTQCGAKLMNRAALAAVMPRLGITRWAFDVDLLFQLQRDGHRLIEVPTTWRDVAGSKLQVLRASMEMFVALVRLRLLYSPLRWLVALYDRTLGLLIHSSGAENDHLVRHGLLLLVGAQVMNLCNLAFQTGMKRMLTDVEYGVVAAMLSLFAIVAMPAEALSRSVAHHTALLSQRGRRDRVLGILLTLARDAVVVGVPIFILVGLASSVLAPWLKLESSLPLLLTALGMWLFICYMVFGGALQGAQAFIWFSAIGIAWSLTRLVIGLAMAVVTGSATGALSAHAMGILVGVLLGIVGVRALFRNTELCSESAREVYRYFLPYMIPFACYAILAFGGEVFVKFFFSAADAGRFSTATVLSRIIIFLPQPIAIALFAKVVSLGQTSRTNWRTLSKALILVGVLVIGAAGICFWFADFGLSIFSGRDMPELVPEMRVFILGCCPLSIAYVIMNFELAQRRFRITAPMIAGVLAYVIGVAVWHGSFMQIAKVFACASSLTMIALIACLVRRTTNTHEKTLPIQ